MDRKKMLSHLQLVLKLYNRAESLKGLHKKYYQAENLQHLFQLECHLFLLCASLHI
jgi:hypothetical protein